MLTWTLEVPAVHTVHLSRSVPKFFVLEPTIGGGRLMSDRNTAIFIFTPSNTDFHEMHVWYLGLPGFSWIKKSHC